MTLPAFPCTQCGLCCQHVNRSEYTINLDRGDGVCLHYNDAEKLCSIYDSRPDICRVDKQYRINYSKYYSWQDFIAANISICQELQSNAIRGK
ncbi:YkgJ family cysteine cluster protein [Aeromonas media]|uniref:YkgJ family cysteine cluster protein n=1 Tax=Aeromonas media TaxID=651 RepID=UPI003872F4DE